MSRTTVPFTEPTSDTIAPGARCGPISFATGPQAPTGMQTMTRSAPSTAAAFELDDLVGEAELGDAPPRFRRAGGGDDGADGVLRLGRARDGRADQADADQRETVEQGLGRAHADCPRNSASAFTTSRLASSVPTLMRSALGR